MTPIPDGHPSIEAVHIPGEGLLYPADPAAPAVPEVDAAADNPTPDVDGSTNRRRRPAPSEPADATTEEA